MNRLLTHSRMDSFKTCRKRSFFEYEVGLRRSIDAKPLRMGTAFHAGLDQLKLDRSMGYAANAARACYDAQPAEYDAAEWETERETVVGLLSGYQWRWSQGDGIGLKVLATERSFNLPLINPETGSASTVWSLAGKIDGIVELEDGRIAVLEHKLLSDTIDAGSDYWRRLQLDHQVTLYVYAARQLGYKVDTVLYDVVRKPTIKPTAVPILDADGLKIVLDQAGARVLNKNGKPRQTADTDLGYAIQTRPMTTDEWMAKLMEDIGQRPEYYFVRQEIPRLDQDIDEFQAEVWDIQKTIRDAQRLGRWFRTVNRNTCPMCAFFGLCTTKYDPASGEVPEGFVKLENLHPELSEVAQ